MDVKAQSGAASRVSPDQGSKSRERTNKETPDAKRGSFTWFLVKLLVVVLVFRIAVFSPFSIPSESMLPRLVNGDYLLAAKWPYGLSVHSLPLPLNLPEGRVLAREPQRGDIVLFKHPVDGRDYIKRLIALPGDEIALRNGRVVLNGELLAREQISDFVLPLSSNTDCAWGGTQIAGPDGAPACRYDRFRETLPDGRSYDVLDFGPTPADGFATVFVPEGHMFVLGDNRDNSRDSRFEARAGDAVGIVSQDLLVGRAAIIMWSSDGSAEWLKPWTWLTAARWDRIGRLL
ncbi:signal peptidase I [Erythrobacter sp.]|jgi:signal peptidase I|uniref:signal peptidase I n=1 Tax=Erythrobacter sp. TaxID=1042 RepID=UPI002EAADC34|nr:signal peptidase I [Erythrobacter sp.]